MPKTFEILSFVSSEKNTGTSCELTLRYKPHSLLHFCIALKRRHKATNTMQCKLDMLQANIGWHLALQSDLVITINAKKCTTKSRFLKYSHKYLHFRRPTTKKASCLEGKIFTDQYSPHKVNTKHSTTILIEHLFHNHFVQNLTITTQ